MASNRATPRSPNLLGTQLLEMMAFVFLVCISLHLFVIVAANEVVWKKPLDRPLMGIVVLHANMNGDPTTFRNDWLMDTVFPTPYFVHITINDYNIIDHLILFNRTAPHIVPTVLSYNIENSGDDALYTIPRRLIALYKIPVVFNPSDEWKGWSKKYKYGEGTELYPLVKMAIREYSVNPYRDANHPHHNVVQIPLGYPNSYFHVTPLNHSMRSIHPLWQEIQRDELTTTILPDNVMSHDTPHLTDATTQEFSKLSVVEHDIYERLLSLSQEINITGVDYLRYATEHYFHSSSTRKYQWAFIGAVAGASRNYLERRAVMGKYAASSQTPHFFDDHTPSPLVRSIYGISKFVLSMKGQYNMECYRYTEAAFAGAIPVIVGDWGEMTMEYDFEGDRPPFIFDDNFDHAFETIRSLSDEIIDQYRANITQWYIRRLSRIQQKTYEFALEQHMEMVGHVQHLRHPHSHHHHHLNHHHNSPFYHHQMEGYAGGSDPLLPQPMRARREKRRALWLK